MTTFSFNAASSRLERGIGLLLAHPDVDRDAGQQQDEAVKNGLRTGTDHRPHRVGEGDDGDDAGPEQALAAELLTILDEDHQFRHGAEGVGHQRRQRGQQDDEGEDSHQTARAGVVQDQQEGDQHT